jgi:carbamoyltransferase
MQGTAAGRRDERAGTVILGLNAYHGDASAALLVDGELRCAIEEERLSRHKHAAGFPQLAAAACLELAGIRPEELTHIAVSRDPRVHLAHKAAHVLERAAHGGVRSLAQTLRARLENQAQVRGGSIRRDLSRALGVPESALTASLHAVEHHRAHLGSAFFASGFADAAVLSLDGFGDFVSTMWGRGEDRHIEVLGEVRFPHSLGVVYTAVTQWLGFPKYGDEGKVMGLAAYGEPRLLQKLRRLITLRDDGTFRLELGYFRHSREGVDMTFASGTPRLGVLYSGALCELLGPPRAPGEPLADLHRDVAASLQALLEEVVLHVCRGLHRKTGQRRLALAGGVALNSVANGKILDHTEFTELFVQPAAGDNGTSLGAALWVEHQLLGRPRRFTMAHAYTGPSFDTAACERALCAELGPDAAPPASGASGAAPVVRIADVATIDPSGSPVRAALRIQHLSEADLVERAAAAIADGWVLGWFQGRMEFGPRALGHRSILCDPRRPDMKDTLNRRIKHREPFRPFAPAVLAEETPAWFVRAAPSPAMLLVDHVRPDKRALVPAITHHDGTGRLQTVEREHSPLLHALISAFARRTGVPMLLNTSFNEHEPIVCTPADALRCFIKARMDALALGTLWIEWARDGEQAG